MFAGAVKVAYLFKWTLCQVEALAGMLGRSINFSLPDQVASRGNRRRALFKHLACHAGSICMFSINVVKAGLDAAVISSGMSGWQTCPQPNFLNE